MILEGLNVLQVAAVDVAPTEFVSDYFDFSIYIDADEEHIEEWYVERFLKLRETVFQDPDSFFRHYADLSNDEAVETARFIWREINGKNLRENIAPTKVARPPAAAQGRRPPRHRACRCAGCSRVSGRSASAGRSASESSSTKSSSCSTCSSSHRRWYGTCTAWPPSAMHRQDVAAHAVADHQEPVGLDAEPRAAAPAYVSESFSSTISRWSKWWARPLVVILCVWWTRSPLVIRTSGTRRADLGEHLGHVGEQAHRLLELGPRPARPARR